MSTITNFDIGAFARAAQERDADTQLSMYAPDAVVTIVDRISQPGSPRVLRTRSEVQTWLRDQCDRDMTHQVTRSLQTDDAAAFTLACRYPDGTNVLCATVIGLSGGQIAEQTIVQAWDEA
jgi:hypothetical protein